MRQITVVGGGLAGLLAAIRLSRVGHEVTLVEKQEFPRHKVCGEYISMEAHNFLKREHLLPDKKKLPFINKLALTSTSGESSDISLKSGGFGISRYYYEKFLYEKAINNGVKVLHDEVLHIETKKEHSIKTRKGVNIISDIVIAAYGKRSRLDKNLNRSFFYKHSPYVGVKFHAKYLQHDRHTIALHNFSGGYCGICKVEDEITNFCYLVHRDKLKEEGSIENLEQTTLYKNPYLKEALIHAERLFNKPVVINEICFETKSPVEDGVLMIGDAAGMITPICGNGMAMAIHSAKLVTDIIIENPMQSVVSICRIYEDAWKKLFSSRLTWGRFIQKHFFGKSWSSALAVAIGNNLPPVANYFIEKTHGRQI